MSEIITVGLGERAYDIHVGDGLLARAGELLKAVRRGVVPVVTDSHVAELHLPRLLDVLRKAGHRRPRHRDAAGRRQQKFRRAGETVRRSCWTWESTAAA